jgi:hypothetical protein
VGILATIGQLLFSWAGPEGWRRRREQLVPPSKATYDAYPDEKGTPSIRFYVEARDVKGRLLREYVDLEGYSVHNIDWRMGRTRGGTLVRDWFVSQMLDALIKLEVRLDEVKDSRREFSYPEEKR